MSVPHLQCLLMRLHPSGVRTSAKIEIKTHETIEYAEKHDTEFYREEIIILYDIQVELPSIQQIKSFSTVPDSHMFADPLNREYPVSRQEFHFTPIPFQRYFNPAFFYR